MNGVMTQVVMEFSRTKLIKNADRLFTIEIHVK
jgi:hypothetical protein